MRKKIKNNYGIYGTMRLSSVVKGNKKSDNLIKSEKEFVEYINNLSNDYIMLECIGIKKIEVRSIFDAPITFVIDIRVKPYGVHDIYMYSVAGLLFKDDFINCLKLFINDMIVKKIKLDKLGE